MRIGDPAPPFRVGEWIQGEPVGKLTKGKVYVIGCWSTWGGVSKPIIKHLDRLHRELNDESVIFIGLNCLEQEPEKVRFFVEGMGAKMSYRVVTDDTSRVAKGFMAERWAGRSGQVGVFGAFVVGRDRRISWFGHPGQLTPEMLRQVADDTLDRSRLVARQRAKAVAEPARQELSLEFNAALEARDWDAAGAVIDQLGILIPDDRLNHAALRFMVAMGKNDQDQVVNQAEKLMQESTWDLAGDLRQVIWGIATELPAPSAEALAVAVRAVEKVFASDPDAWGYLLALARIQFMQGHRDEAVRTQERAVALEEKEEGDEDDLEAMKADLESFRQGILPEA